MTMTKIGEQLFDKYTHQHTTYKAFKIKLNRHTLNTSFFCFEFIGKGFWSYFFLRGQSLLFFLLIFYLQYYEHYYY